MNTIIGIFCTLMLALVLTLTVKLNNRDATITVLQAAAEAKAATIERMGNDARQADEAKRSTDETIKGLRDRLATCVGEKQETEKLASAATARARAAEREARRARDELTEQREQLYAADPSSDAWRGTVLPAGVALGMRIEWDKARAAGMPDDAGADDRGRTAPTAGADAGRADGDPVAAALAGAYDWTRAVAVPEYTNGQLRDALSDALTGYTIAASRLREIGRMQAEATP